MQITHRHLSLARYSQRNPLALNQPPVPSWGGGRTEPRPHHVLHTDADLPIAVECAIETNNVGGVAFVKHLELTDNLVSDGRFDLQVNQLQNKEGGQENQGEE